METIKGVRVVIKSTLGGNLRLRVPNGLRLISGRGLEDAAGINQNSFYQLEEIQRAAIAPQATVVLPALKNTFLYDLSTQAGKQYELILK